MSGSRLALAGLIMGYVSLVLGVGVLVLGGLGGMRFVQERAALKGTVSTHAVIMAGLQLYKEKFGEYPAPAKSGMRVHVGDADYDVSGALMLYQALTADGTDMIRLKDGIGRPSDGKIDDAEKKDQLDMSPLPKYAVFKTSAGYILVDGWGHPFQYTIAGPESVNPAYDLWSFGMERSPLPADKSAKQDPTRTARWIKNW
jgi:hypothetical protein